MFFISKLSVNISHISALLLDIHESVFSKGKCLNAISILLTHFQYHIHSDKIQGLLVHEFGRTNDLHFDRHRPVDEKKHTYITKLDT